MAAGHSAAGTWHLIIGAQANSQTGVTQDGLESLSVGNQMLLAWSCGLVCRQKESWKTKQPPTAGFGAEPAELWDWVTNLVYRVPRGVDDPSESSSREDSLPLGRSWAQQRYPIMGRCVDTHNFFACVCMPSNILNSSWIIRPHKPKGVFLASLFLRPKREKTGGGEERAGVRPGRRRRRRRRSTRSSIACTREALPLRRLQLRLRCLRRQSSQFLFYPFHRSLPYLSFDRVCLLRPSLVYCSTWFVL